MIVEFSTVPCAGATRHARQSPQEDPSPCGDPRITSQKRENEAAGPDGPLG